jgi:hypothetical protein
MKIRNKIFVQLLSFLVLAALILVLTPVYAASDNSEDWQLYREAEELAGDPYDWRLHQEARELKEKEAEIFDWRLHREADRICEEILERGANFANCNLEVPSGDFNYTTTDSPGQIIPSENGNSNELPEGSKEFKH